MGQGELTTKHTKHTKVGTKSSQSFSFNSIAKPQDAFDYCVSFVCFVVQLQSVFPSAFAPKTFIRNLFGWTDFVRPHPS